jgi:membrane protease YdiL (CAAX protease family)
MKSLVERIWQFPPVPIVVYLLMCYQLIYAVGYVLSISLPELFASRSPLMLLIYSVSQFAITAALLYGLFCLPQRRSFASAGFDPKQAPFDVVVGFLCGILLVSTMVAAMAAEDIYHVLDFDSSTNFFIPATVFFFDAFSEEIIFRSFIFLTVEKKWGTWAALAITCILFGAAHIINPIPNLSFSEKAFGCFCLMIEAGLVLGSAYLVRRSLWLPLGLHWAWNFFEGPIFGTSVSGSNICKPLITARLDGPFYATGGAFGPEASLTGLVIGTMAGIAMLAYASKFGSLKQEKS